MMEHQVNNLPIVVDKGNSMHYKHTMAREGKTTMFSLRMRPSVRDLLDQISEYEDRKPGDMIEYLIKDFARRIGLDAPPMKGGDT
jgi:hypothetical protein